MFWTNPEHSILQICEISPQGIHTFSAASRSLFCRTKARPADSDCLSSPSLDFMYSDTQERGNLSVKIQENEEQLWRKINFTRLTCSRDLAYLIFQFLRLIGSKQTDVTFRKRGRMVRSLQCLQLTLLARGLSVLLQEIALLAPRVTISWQNHKQEK